MAILMIVNYWEQCTLLIIVLVQKLEAITDIKPLRKVPDYGRMVRSGIFRGKVEALGDYYI